MSILKEINWSLIIGISFILSLVGLAVSTRNDISCTDEEPFGWSIAIMIFFIVAIPLICGYFGALHNK